MPEGQLRSEGEDDDPDLLRLMACGRRHPTLAKAAWATLYQRYNERLTNHVRRCYGRARGGDAGVQDLVHSVWARAYEHADTYSAPPDFAAGAEVELWTMGWLRSIARSVHFDERRTTERCHVPVRGTGAPLHAKLSSPTGAPLDYGPNDVPSRDALRKQVIYEAVAALAERVVPLVRSRRWGMPHP